MLETSRKCFLLVLLAMAISGFAQNSTEDYPSSVEYIRFSFLNSIFTESFDLSPRLEFFHPVYLSNEAEISPPGHSIFANSPQWVKDLRRGEIVFFGSLPFTVFFSRTIMGLFRMGSHGWDRRYAPWPFASAGAVQMNNNELILMFSVAASASLIISVVDHFIVQKKRKAAVPE